MLKQNKSPNLWQENYFEWFKDNTGKLTEDTCGDLPDLEGIKIIIARSHSPHSVA